MKTEETYEEGDRCQVIGCEGTLAHASDDAPLKCNVCDEVHNEA